MASSLELKRVLYETAFLQRSPQQKQQQPQQTVDLLLGLLVYIAWGWEHLVAITACFVSWQWLYRWSVSCVFWIKLYQKSRAQ